MTKKQIGWMLAGALLFSAIALRGAIYVIDNYVFDDDGKEAVVHVR